jgi:hypothetical protein
VAYVFPLGGGLLSMICLHEQLLRQITVSAALITSALAVVNWKKK